MDLNDTPATLGGGYVHKNSEDLLEVEKHGYIADVEPQKYDTGRDSGENHLFISAICYAYMSDN